MTKIDKKDLKSPDKLQKELQKGFEWTTQHSKLVGIGALAFLVIGAGVSAKSYLDERKEKELQSRYYQVEKKMMDQKEAFLKAEAPPAPKDPKAKTPPPAAAEVKSSGDLQKDYGTVTGEFSQIITEAPGSKAAKMAALSLASLQLQYKKSEDAKNTLSQVKTEGRDLLSGLVQIQLGTVQAELNDCNSALSTWQKVLANKDAKALHPAVKLKSGLCYETLKDIAKAEQMYTEAKSEDQESATGRSAEKYLRLLQAAK